ncbi:hypothetical protein DRP77_05230 [Candidatus Poribacteria bacterium]|nr:MAG: hypothetical protein DRP77_05230 [Candidatus Poribacteria bacterium]
MYYLIIHLYDEGLQEEVMLALTAEGVTDSFVLDAVNVRRVLAFEMPIFAGFRADLDRRRGFAKFIVALVPDKRTVLNIIETLRMSGVDVEDPEVCRFIFFPVESFPV